jgi:hypothetical protein
MLKGFVIVVVEVVVVVVVVVEVLIEVMNLESESFAAVIEETQLELAMRILERVVKNEKQQIYNNTTKMILQ